MAQAAYLTTVQKSGTTTAMTSEAMATATTVSGTYQITNSAKRVWERTASFTIRIAGSTVGVPADTSVTWDYLFGKVTFTTTQAGARTITGSYLPMTDVAGANSYTLSASRELVDDTDFSSTGWRSKAVALKDVSLTMSRWAGVDTAFFDLINGATPVMCEVKPGSGTLAARGWFLVSGDVRSGDVATLETAELTFDLDQSTAASFGWDNQ